MLPCKYSCSALKSLKANKGAESNFGKSGWKTGSTARARNQTTPMDAHPTLGGAEPGRAAGPLSLDHLAMLRYGHPSNPATRKMEAVRKANLRYFGSVLMLLARGSSQPNGATSNFPPPPRAPPSSSPCVVTLCHVLGISLLPPPRKNTDNDLENSKHFSALLPSFLRRSGDTEGFSSRYREYKKN